ncbi:MAG: hypothetical protein HXX11_19735 [Desulfuromonadales bacterium]|nr:hypothetical protein [Desulfuromonadales bacterium]
MILNPSILALVLPSLVQTLLVAYAFAICIRIVARWDINSGSELQLGLERRTYLVSTIMNMALTMQLLSLFLFIFTADALHSQLSGAMCAVGSLNANPYGYPVLALKLVNFLLCGVWLVINRVDNRAHDYPLIRPKYRFLQLIAPLILVESVLQLTYFLNLKSRILTTCCGSQFGGEGGTVTASIISLPPATLALIFYGAMLATLAAGIRFLVKSRGAPLFGILSGGALLIGIIAMVALISPYYYELPTHHCPFCILQGDYHYIGYPLYLTLLGGGLSGISCGVLAAFRGPASLKSIIPSTQKHLAVISLALMGVFVLMVSWQLVFSGLRMIGE